jgi:hypothetical protein
LESRRSRSGISAPRAAVVPHRPPTRPAQPRLPQMRHSTGSVGVSARRSLV